MKYACLFDRTSISSQISQHIKTMIANSTLNKDEQIPSMRNLAKELGCNANTVARAYKKLEYEGYIYSVSGKGCFVAVQQESIENKLIDEFKESCKDILATGVSVDKLIEIICELKQELE